MMHKGVQGVNKWFRTVCNVVQGWKTGLKQCARDGKVFRDSVQGCARGEKWF